MPDLDLLTSTSDIWKLDADIHTARHPLQDTQAQQSAFSVALIVIVVFIILLLLCFFYLKYRSFQTTHLTRGLMQELRSLRPANNSDNN